MSDFLPPIPPMPPMPPEMPRGPTPEVFFNLQFSQGVQALQNAHHPDHPEFNEIQGCSNKLLTFMNAHESKIKQLCEKNGWSIDETNEHFNQCTEDLQLAQNANANNPASLESAQSASSAAEKIFDHINPVR